MNYLKILSISTVVMLNLAIPDIKASEKDKLIDNINYQQLLHELNEIKDPKDHNEGIVNKVLNQYPVTLAWGDVFTIWGKNALQLVNVYNWIDFFGIEPLNSCSRASSWIGQALENRIAYSIAPINFIFTTQPINEENGTTMCIRGFCKKYNVEILRQKLVDELSKNASKKGQ